MTTSERPAVPEGAPHGGPEKDGYCCGHRTYDDKRVEENNQGKYHSAYQWFVDGTWQCHVREDHNGKLTPTAVITLPVFPGEIRKKDTHWGRPAFELQLLREVEGDNLGLDWKTYDAPLFADVRKMFDHPLLEEVTLSYSGNVTMRFRKKDA